MRRSRSRAGCARGATPRPASRSCTCPTARAFHPMQVVAPNTLPNYADEVLKLTTGCAVEATGTIVPSPAKGQPFEMQAERDQGDRLGRRPGHLSDPAQAAHHGVPARGRAPAAAHQRDRRGDARAAHARRRRSTASSTSTASSGSTRRSSPASDAEGAGALFRVSTLDLANLPRTPHGKIDFAQGLLRPRGVPDRVGPAQRRGLLPGAQQGLHLRADVPRRELQHQPPPRRVLDDRAGDRVRRSRRRRDAGRGLAQVHLRDAAQGARRRHGVLRRADREGPGREACKASSRPSSCAWTTARRSRCSRRPRRSSSSR